jgi:hypothetical protein
MADRVTTEQAHAFFPVLRGASSTVWVYSFPLPMFFSISKGNIITRQDMLDSAQPETVFHWSMSQI